MASQALMHVRAEVIKFRFVTVAAGYAPGRMPPVRWKIPSRFEQGGGSYDTKARPGLVRITKILMSECQSKTLKPDALSDRSRPQGCRRLHFMALKIRLSCRYTAHVCASNRLSHNIQGKAMRVIFRKS